MTDKQLTWFSSNDIAGALLERFPGLNMVEKPEQAVMERIKALPIYNELPPLPDDYREVREIISAIKKSYVRQSAGMSDITYSHDPDSMPQT